MDSSSFFVITGASGAGKSTLSAALRQQGLATVPEVGRSLVREQVARGGTVLPWIDQPSFMEEVLRRNIRDHQAALELSRPVIFDRGIPECMAWARILGVGVQAHHLAAVSNYRYNPLVFVAQPWPE
jgi:predicted ATPase